MITLVGYSPIYVKRKNKKTGVITTDDSFRDIIVWQLDVLVVKKNTELRRLFIEEHPEASIFGLGSEGQVIEIRNDRRYFGDNMLFVPKRILGNKARNITDYDIEQLAGETKSLGGIGYMWEGLVPGVSPTRELLQNAGILSASHVILEDEYLTSRSAINNNPADKYGDAYEVVYKAQERCGFWDCPLQDCRPVERFIDEWRRTAKTKFYPRLVYPSIKLDSNRAKELDLQMAKEKVLDPLYLIAEGLFEL